MVSSIFLLGLFLFMALPGTVSGQGVVSQTITQSSTSVTNCEKCNSTIIAQTVPFSPKIGIVGQDLGTFTSMTSLQGFLINTGGQQSATMGFPSINGLPQSTNAILYNSSATSLQFPGINFFFKPSGYRTSIIIQGNLLSSTISIPFSSPSKASVCDSLQHQYVDLLGNPQIAPPCTQLCFNGPCFDWSDMAAYNPQFNNQTDVLTFSVNGAFTIDPLALDGSNICSVNAATSVTCNLTTSNANDVIIMWAVMFNHNATGISDSGGANLTWHKRMCTSQAGTGYTTFVCAWWAASALALTADPIVVSCTLCTFITVIPWGVSGANTVSPFDSAASLPKFASGNSNPNVNAAPGTFSTSNANDFIFLVYGSSNNGGSTYVVGTPYDGTDVTKPNLNNQIQGGGSATRIDSAAFYNTTHTAYTNIAPILVPSSGVPVAWIEYADAIKQASAATVTENIKVPVANSGAQAVFGIVGCGVSNSTFTVHPQGYTTVYTGITASCSMTVTVSADTTNIRYRFGGGSGSLGIAYKTWTFTTASSGSGTNTNTTYEQLRNLYTATPQTPSTWDGGYDWGITGTIVGQSELICTGLTTQGGGVDSCTDIVDNASIWADYNQVATYPKIGNTWTCTPGSFTDTTGGNTHNANCIQTSSSAPTAPNLSWLLAIAPIVLILIYAKRRR